MYDRVPLTRADPMPEHARIALLVTEEDLSPESWPLGSAELAGVAVFKPEADGSAQSENVRAFKIGAMMDAAARCTARWGRPVAAVTSPAELAEFARTHNVAAAITTRVPVGYVQAELAQWIGDAHLAPLRIVQIHRRWDALFWPYATAGFFKLKERIPAVLAKLDMTQQGSAA
jgi:deoxyribodipyrimidine photo-lyase